MDGKTCIVTGATSGIGMATARELARRGARVAIVCRSEEKGRETIAAIRRETGNEALDLFVADLSSQAEIRRVAAEILDRCPEIHVLVNNAAVINLRRETTVDGIETTFAVNHLAYFLLTQLLLQRILATPGARIVNVSSEGHRVGPMNWDDLGFETGYGVAKVYGHSKLANILFTAELARRIEGSGVTVNCLHPGGVSTGLGTNNAPGWLVTLLRPLLRAFLRTPEQGAETSLYLATSPDVANVSGRYFANCVEKEPTEEARNPETARRLWSESERLVGIEV